MKKLLFYFAISLVISGFGFLGLRNFSQKVEAVGEVLGNSPTVLTQSLPNGWTNRPYIATIRTRDVDVGDKLGMIASDLPEGLSLSNCSQFVLSNSERLHCDLSGVVAEPGTYTFKIGVFDNNGNFGSQVYTINFEQAP
ncbi:hypothetical protein A2574_03330 [Candidatus Shapirobacteria bacterium RIFOXYD1_FULL_38_32]|uniref:Uncharacterized protein n=3 Tax=Candidatus Shapironibacteriota TaxID=1752721 RepID=A0A0G0N021_9BACT|nr:MAG: hypothetical protein US90_C0006G0014 [Candidatus Shapirobacteria bacterium GW2011_GWE2_38_30]KKQ89921.1 MAG: hypothetical protein UT14_C0048G0002 [Candidatus Shapirobacteria bacterium GW2011_GWE1_38_92]OGL56279.1 MAG: hypothetical protein A2195_00900 [Candidatus Shapirobacteria bacterium RIFOXYA1_FULL_39_17]OGL57279.1 MAG: hypothetical protein A2410_03600 [Candidatus Shapirobacteria bacterium RIFOXYC1_FULL_38_24]OGL57379.1 MAG: hypothetical protein A2367_01630 [Candidatus Shapirobacteri